MNELRCDQVHDALPDRIEGRLSPDRGAALDAHLAECAECRESLSLLSLLREARPAVPSKLAERITVSVRRRGRSVARPAWGLAAAAVAALALGIGVTGQGEPQVDVPAFVAEGGGSSSWIADDGLVAGAATLSDLPEEALLTLLDELGSGRIGGGGA